MAVIETTNIMIMNKLKSSDLMLDDWIYAGDRLKNVQVSRIYEHNICTKEGF